MKILRVKLTNYRGVDSSEVEFSPNGITIIEGPNEVGKTSISEAIGILFDYQDSSKNQTVKAIQPVHKDVGAEVELEAKSGSYHFIYFKRFNKKHETKLRIISPSPANLTGREAHEKAEEILQSTIDVNLWKALRIQQGDSIQQADLSSQTSLSRALDAAASGEETNPREENIFERAQSEFAKYYTEKGSDKKAVKDALATQESLESDVSALDSQLQGLDKDIIKSVELEHALQQSKRKEAELKTDRDQHTKAYNEIQKLEDKVENAQLKCTTAKQSADEANRILADRQTLKESVEQAKQKLKLIEECAGEDHSSIQKSEKEFKQSESETGKAEKVLSKADDLFKIRRFDADYLKDKHELEKLVERRDKVVKSRNHIAKAETLLAKNLVDEDMLEEIQEADQSFVTADARMQAGSPSILMKGLEKASLLLNGKKTSLKKGEEKTISVSKDVSLTIPGSLEITVSAGSDSSDSLEEYEEAKRTLADICKEAGVKDAKEARKIHKERNKAEQELEMHRDAEVTALRDLSYDELVGKVTRLQETVPAYEKQRRAQPNIASALDEAKKLLVEAEEGLDSATETRDSAKRVSEEHRSFLLEKKSNQKESSVRLDYAKEDIKEANESLAVSRNENSDGDLDKLVTKTSKALQVSNEAYSSTSENLESKNPEKVKYLLEVTEGSLETTITRLKSLSEESSEVRGRLKVLGEAGLQEKLNSALTSLEHIKRENQATIRRAAAAKMLYLTLREMREEARRAYVAPLKAKIESLGRLVFNNTFQVEVTEELSVASRTLDDTTVEFDSLSGGTREQISLIARLACAMTVSENGGAPLLLDDELGYTDNDRLKLMGAVLAKAGKECQVIILTCVLDRYSNIGNAKVVRLS